MKIKYIKLILLAAMCGKITFLSAQQGAQKKQKSGEELAYEELFKSIKPKADSLFMAFSKLPAEEKKNEKVITEFTSKQKAIYEKIGAIRLQYILDHPNSQFTLSVLKEHDGGGFSVTPDLVEPLFKTLSKSVQESEEGKAYRERIEINKNLKIGALAPVFAQPDTAGKMISLRDFRGKYVLIDFWASWCGPCRAENPNVLRAYNAYKEKNFTVLGVSVDKESARGAWVKAINDDGMPWIQVCELTGWKNTAAKLYDVHAIPENYLIDPSGKIIAKNLRGEQLHKALDALLSK